MVSQIIAVEAAVKIGLTTNGEICATMNTSNSANGRSAHIEQQHLIAKEGAV